MDREDMGGGRGGGERGVRVLFNAGKKETRTPSKGFKQLKKKLKVGFEVNEHKDPVDRQTYNTANVDIAVFAGTCDKFKADEFQALVDFIEQGGSVIVMLGEGGEKKSGTNLNYLLEHYGMFVNPDQVVRTVYMYPYSHPKEACIQHGVVNRELTNAAEELGGNARASLDMGASLTSSLVNNQQGLSVLFPYGATIQVAKPAVPLVSTGQEAYPLNRPIMAVYDGKTATDSHKRPWTGSYKGTTINQSKKGRLLVVGSAKIFDDDWVLKEENSKLLEILIRWMKPDETIKLNQDDADDFIQEHQNSTDHHYVPDTGAMAQRMRCCLQEADEVPQDFTQLFDSTLFTLSTDKIPEVLKLYKEMDVKHEVLTLIPPQFESPLPPLQPAVFPPAWREPPPPALDLFDLDEHFASERVRLAQLTNKCKDPDNLDFYIRQAAEVLGVPEKLPEGKKSAKHCLEVIMRELVNWKRMAPDSSLGALGGGVGQHL